MARNWAAVPDEDKVERGERILALLREMHAGIEDGECKTQEEIADFVGVARNVIQKEEISAIRKIRENPKAIQALNELLVLRNDMKRETGKIKRARVDDRCDFYA